ncbi:hypothetical protein AFM16_31615 [Streptomyces antibioticus]|uniref:Uncharacterized protein n=1 Tax=Streptomyces antibioticus TaxID=1890 RepID=A0ABX3LA28_STRAT|nr:hypothetical protein AFM16_31615 [Streptomyces antibioticus]
MCRDKRTTKQVQGAITAGARLAHQIESDPMSTPQQRDLANKLHDQINTELTELDHRRNH